MGTEWLLDGRAYRVVRQLDGSRFVAQDIKFNLEQEFSESRILALYSERRLRFAGAENPSCVREGTSKPRAFDDLDKCQQGIVESRWHAIEPLTRMSHRPTTVDFQQRAIQLYDAGSPISSRSLRRYFVAWKRSDGDRLSLLPKTFRSGARGRFRRTSMLRRYPVLNRLVEEAIAAVYLTTARRSQSAVARRVLEDLQLHNARVLAHEAIPIPRYAALERAIARRIAQLDPWEVDRARWGRRIADRRHAATSNLRQATRILQRVEIDHSPLKVVVGTQSGPIGQPWLTVLIDYYSRMVVGFCLGFEPPSYAVIMEALRHSILPKSYVKERFERVQGNWPCFGLPEKLVCDRGADLTSKDLEQAAFQLNIELDFNPPRTPHFKGTVESFFDLLNDQLVASLPGRTFRSWQQRADYKPDEGPLIPYETLLEIIHIHLIDVYAASKHPTSARTRLEIWHECALEHPPCLPASPDELVVLLARRVERTLSVRGIELNGMFYNCDELMALRAELAAHNRATERFHIRYNPWDLGHAWVLNPLDQRYLRITSADPVMQGMTEHQWNVLKRAVRQRFEQPEHLLSLASGRNAIRDAVAQTVTKPSRKRRVRAARFLGTPRIVSEPATSPPEEEVMDGIDSAPTAIEKIIPEIDSNGQRTAGNGLPCAHVDPADLDVDGWEVSSG